MAGRRPSEPPILPGFTYVRLLGSGGFADVFLYEQNMPRRQVAVKVMLASIVTDHVRRMFQVEANLMAQLSSHPGILTVYQASISPDGRPYLVMEVCSAQLSSRYRVETIPVAEVLRIGVQVGSAIETAHRAGVLHRDVKPSNILMTAFGHPVLSDFGIASTLSASGGVDTVGMSIPWSAPEVLLDQTTGTVTSEVWSLAATLYTLLAGRSPFEVLDGSNAADDMIRRITRTKLQPLSRPDVPAALIAVLARALNRDPERRQQSVLELIRDLQRIEAEQGYAATQADIAMDDWALATVSDPADRTIIRAVDPRAPSVVSDRRRRRRAAAAALADSTGESATMSPASVRRTRLLTGALLVLSLAVISIGATATLIAIQDGDGELPRVSNVEARVDGATIVFSWSDPGLATSDVYQLRLADGTESFQRSSEFIIAAVPGDRVCLIVRVAREGRLGAPSGEKCVDVTGG